MKLGSLELTISLIFFFEDPINQESSLLPNPFLRSVEGTLHNLVQQCPLECFHSPDGSCLEVRNITDVMGEHFILQVAP